MVLHPFGAEACDDDDVGHAVRHQRGDLPAYEGAAVEIDHAFGHVAGQRQQARSLARGKDDGFRNSHEAGRSEEHTSELQSLMRISYAVFCLKKKKITEITKTEEC